MLSRNCSVGIKLQVKAPYISSTWGVRRIKEKKKIRSSKSTSAFGVVGNFGAWGSKISAHRACRDYRKLWK